MEDPLRVHDGMTMGREKRGHCSGYIMVLGGMHLKQQAYLPLCVLGPGIRKIWRRILGVSLTLTAIPSQKV